MNHRDLIKSASGNTVSGHLISKEVCNPMDFQSRAGEAAAVEETRNELRGRRTSTGHHPEWRVQFAI